MVLARCSRFYTHGWNIVRSTLHRPQCVYFESRRTCFPVRQFHHGHCEQSVQIGTLPRRQTFLRLFCTFKSQLQMEKSHTYEFNEGMSEFLERNKHMEKYALIPEDADPDKTIEELKPDELDDLNMMKLEFEYMKLEGQIYNFHMRNKDWIFVMNRGRGQTRAVIRKLFWLVMLKQQSLVNDGEKEQLLGNQDKKKRSHIHLYMDHRDNIRYVYEKYSLYYSWHFAQRIVFDCGLEDVYTHRELTKTAKQILYALGVNCWKDQDALFPYLCNFKSDGRLAKKISKMLCKDSMVEAKAALNCICTEKSYLDLFPKENLVYLTPDSDKDLRYDHRDIYIVGAIVDLSVDHPVTLANAREMGLRHARIPVQKYCKLSESAQLKFPLDAVLMFLRHIQSTKDFKEALKVAVPPRHVDYWY